MADDSLLKGANSKPSTETLSAAANSKITERLGEPPAPPNEPGARGPADDDLYDFLRPVQQTGTPVEMGPYHVVGVIGRGGMGIVLKAEDPHLGRGVAIKILKPALAASSTARQRFLREARAAAAITNDYIVRIYHVGEHQGVPYLVMPLLAGETLQERFVREGRLPLAEVLRIGREAATGLAAAHDRALVHRDIKPSNLWLDGDSGRVHILDFGLARSLEENSQLSHAGAPVGTPAYMAPEQARGQSAGPRADLFSLGCILYRLSTGVAPFDSSTPQALYRALECDQPRPPEQLDPTLPPAFARLVERMLAREEGNRPASAHDVVREISAIEEALSRGSAPRRRRWVSVLLGCAAIIAVATLGYFGAPMVYRLATDQGDLVIETNDPRVEVIIKDGAGRVIDHTAKREILLKSGEYQLDCVIVDAAGELRFLTRRLTLRRGDRLVVDAHVEPGKPAAENARKVLRDQEVRAAQWALARGATGKILVRGNREDLALAGKEPDGTYQVVNLVFAPESNLSDKDLDYLHELPSLTSLKLHGDWVSDASLARLKGMNNLVRLDVAAPGITDQGLAFVSELTNLEFLVLGECAVTDAGLVHLKKMPKLRRLQLGLTRITEAGLDTLASLPSLTGSLTFDNGQVTDAWLARLTRLSGLNELWLANNPIGDAGLASLEAFANLVYLNLSYTKVGDRGLVHVKPLVKLESLRLAGTAVSDAGLQELRGLKALRELDLTKTKVTQAGVADLRKTLPGCHILFGPEPRPTK
jgi:hypothetical protein